MTRTPSRIDIAPGAEVMVDGKPGVVLEVRELDAVLVREAASGRVRQVAVKQIAPSQTPAGEQSGGLTLEGVPDADWKIAEERLDIIRPLLNKKGRTRADVASRAAEFERHPNTVYGWLGAYESSGRLTALLPRGRKDKGTRRLPEKVEALLSEVIEEEYLTTQRKSITKVHEELRRRCLAAKIDPPHANTLRARIAELTEYKKLRHRVGRKTADQKLSPIDGAFPGADWPLAIVQIDHTKLDIILVDDLHRRPIGRPWITLAIDVFSRMVVGFYISFDPPGALSTGLCVAHAILPKEKWLAKHDLDGEWPVWGLPKTLHMDNAKEFRGLMLQRACAEYGIDIAWRPVAQPHFGGHVERMLGTASREIHTLPGTTFSNPQHRGEYDSEGKAALTLSEFESWLATYLIKVYHQRQHSSLGMSPLAKYREGVFGSDKQPGAGLPSRVADEDRLRLDFTPFVERTVQDYGVVIDEVHYYHDVLRRWIGASDPAYPKRKRKFVFRRDPRDISTIWFHDPEVGAHFAIPYRDTSHPAISIWELREAERNVKQSGKPIDERALFDAYERMREIETQAQAKTKAARRAQQRRKNGAAAPKPAGANPKPHAPTNSAPEIAAVIEPFEELDLLNHDAY